MTLLMPVFTAVSGAWPGMVAFVWFGLVVLCWGSQRRYPVWTIHYNVSILITFENLVLGQFLAICPCSWHWKQGSSVFDIMLTVNGGVIVAVSCCTALSFSTLDITSLSVCGPFSYMWVARLWAFFKPSMNILMEAASFIKLHLLVSVLNQWMYAAKDSSPGCWISMKGKV